VSREAGGRWAKLADVLAKDYEYKPLALLEYVWIDRGMYLFHARSDCPLIIGHPDEYGRLYAMLNERRALALGYWRCWTCYPKDAATRRSPDGRNAT
jgi:hypothetical protein